MRAKRTHPGFGKLIFLLGFLSWFPDVQAADLRWVSKLCVVVNGEFEICKPSPKWDTQVVEHLTTPVKWVFHQGGANPVMQLRFDAAPTGITTFDYALDVKKGLATRGVQMEEMRDIVVRRKNISLIIGSSRKEGLRYLVAVWLTGDRGFILECTSNPDDFSKREPDFMATIQSVKFLGE